MAHGYSQVVKVISLNKRKLVYIILEEKVKKMKGECCYSHDEIYTSRDWE